jgi:signal transduction histidine kinase
MLAGVPRRYGFAVGAVVLALVLRRLLSPLFGEASLHGMLLSAIVISAWYAGRGPGAAATIMAALASSIELLPAPWSLSIAASSSQLQLALFLVEGLMLSVLVGTLHARLHNAEAAIHARDDLLAIAAHEFKTPLTTVLGYTQTLQMRAAREGYLPRRDQDTLRLIAGQARRLHTLIDSVLDLAQLHNGQARIVYQVVDLARLARRVVGEASQMAVRHTIEFQGTDTPVMIEGDQVRLEQVLQNLLDNAVKYSPEGGAITVGVEQRNGEAVLSVGDQGIGIPEEARAQLFDRFYRAGNIDRRRMHGTGIGLSIVTEIVALHGGAVEVESVVGQGSTFIIRLPLRKERVTMRSAAAIPPGDPAASLGTARANERPDAATMVYERR